MESGSVIRFRVCREVYQMGIITEFIAIVSGVLVGEWIARRIDRK
ncbi:MAG: hypothetical protein ACLTK5_06220 [Clostridium sp.]